MKSKILLFIASLLLSFQMGGAQNIDREINDLINSGDYLTLNRRYTAVKDSIQNPVLRLMAEGFIYTSLNQPAKACEAFGALAANHQKNMDMNGITAVISLMCENLRYMGKYSEASDIMKSFLDQTATFDGLDSVTRTNLEMTLPLGKLGDRPIVIERPDRDCEIPVTMMGEGELKRPYINAKLNGNDVSFIFDTGAEGYATNFVSEGFARKNGIRIISDSVIVSGGTGSRGYVKLGIADSVQIGDITYKNVRFTIAPGENTSPVDSVYIDAVLGSAFMKAMGEMQFYPKENKIVFPARQTPMPESGQNMVLLGGQPFFEVYNGDERLYMHFDTGGEIILFDTYYKRHKQEVESAGTLKTNEGMLGFGEVKKFNMYILPSFFFRLSGKTVQVQDVTVHTASAQLFSNPVIDGMVGYDFINLFDKFTVNFDKMFVIAE